MALAEAVRASDGIETRRDGDALIAPAKVNLALHVVGRRADGYHLLDGLVGFADFGDRIEVDSSEIDRLVVTGPFAGGVPSGGDNILLRALDLARAAALRHGETIVPLEIRLEKSLPVAAGIGGGSADAAALLRRLAAFAPSLRPELPDIGSRLGADVAMCLLGRPARTEGIGEILTPVRMPALPIVLANPLVPVPTATIFQALRQVENEPLPPLPAKGFETLATLLDYLRACRNDLEETACALFPAIDAVARRLRGFKPAQVRMSGSGGTVFALFENQSAAEHAAGTLSAERPDWWVASGEIGAGRTEETT